MRLLVIEDDLKIANAIKKGLEQEKFAVDIQANGRDGLTFALTEDYDTIILDLMLPLIDGLQICRTLRDKKISTPILMLTAKGSVGDKVIGLNDGADDYLAKPFSFEELVARVRALSRRPKETHSTILKRDDLTLNTATFEVERAGNKINLTSKEYALLEYLLRNQEKILTKDQIISHVWDYDADILPNTVEVYIGYLRNKIDKPFKKPALIKTVRGFGYKVGK